MECDPQSQSPANRAELTPTILALDVSCCFEKCFANDDIVSCAGLWLAQPDVGTFFRKYVACGDPMARPCYY